MSTIIRPVQAGDATAMTRIYNHYIANTSITFEEELITPGIMTQRVAINSAALPWLVCCDEGQLLGYAYATPWRARSAYRYSIESTVYLDHQVLGRGLGSALLKALLTALSPLAMHTIVAGISLPNEASIRLHEKFGFEKVGEFREIGKKFNQWLNVGYWQRIM